MLYFNYPYAQRGVTRDVLSRRLSKIVRWLSLPRARALRKAKGEATINCNTSAFTAWPQLYVGLHSSIQFLQNWKSQRHQRVVHFTEGILDIERGHPQCFAPLVRFLDHRPQNMDSICASPSLPELILFLGHSGLEVILHAQI